jgi:magnesium transporter
MPHRAHPAQHRPPRPTLHQPPGTPIYTGPARDHDVSLHLVTYNESVAEEHAAQGGAEVLRRAGAWRRPDRITWVHVDGVHDVDIVGLLGDVFELHGLAVEDIVTLETRAKAEDYGLSVVVNLKHLRLTEGAEAALSEEHVSLVLGEGWVLSFQELPAPLFAAVRTRVMQARGRIRQRAADYLLHALLDAIIDDYRAIADRFSDAVDALEERPTDRFDEALPGDVHRLKAQLQAFRRAAKPVREALAILEHARPELVHKATLPFFRDLLAHLNEVVELSESLRERLDNTLELHLALASHRMNETMRVLTVVTAIFIPLSFIAGVYGMNFDAMPELHSRWGYPAVLGFMGVLAAGLLLRFRRSGWI